MRFDFTGLRQALPDKLVPSLSTAFAAGGVSLASLMVGYVVLFGGGQSVADTDARTTTVAVAGPVFTPVVATPKITESIEAPSRTTARSETAMPPAPQDARSLTRAVQAALKEAGCYRGKVNGAWTPQTSAAMDEFTMRVNARLPVDKPDPVLLALLETHDDVSCAAGDAAPSPRTETARADEARPTVSREATLSTTSAVGASARAEHLSFAGPGWQRREMEIGRPVNASVGAGEAAGAHGADVDPAPVVRAPKKAMKRDRRARNVGRKYRRKPSLSRDVRRSFRSIQRSMSRLF